MSHMPTTFNPATPSTVSLATPRAMLRTGMLAAIAVSAVMATGCVTRTVYVTEGGQRVDNRPVASDPYAGTYNDAPAVADVSANTEFYSALAPYGSWTQHPSFGDVFVPNVRVTGPNFRPYAQGHWEYTEWGWTFVSHQPFGWATAHYGRWFYDSRLGWAWVPGTQWSPAWVTWRTGGGYVGWAPMPPGAAYGSNYNVYSTGWVFVSYNNFGADVIYPVMIRGSRYDDCYRRTSPYRVTVRVRGRDVYRGPNPTTVSSNGGRVSRRPLRDIDRDRPTSTAPTGVTVRRSREQDGGDHQGYAGRDRTAGNTGRDRGDGRDTGRDRGDGRDRDDGHDIGRDRDAGRDTIPNRGSTIIDDDRGITQRDRNVGRDTTPNRGSTIIDDDRGITQRDRVTTPDRGTGIIDDDRGITQRDRNVGPDRGSRPSNDDESSNLGLGGINVPNRGSRASNGNESSNADLGSRDRPNRGSTIIDNDNGVRPGRTVDPYSGQRAPDLSAEIPDNRPQRPYNDSPNGPDARSSIYRRTAPSNPGILSKPAPMTKPGITPAPSPSTSRPAVRPAPSLAPSRAPAIPPPAQPSKSKSKSKSKSSSDDDSKKSSRSKSRSRR